MSALGQTGHTCRGFPLIYFPDRDGVECSLQQSSLADEDAIWLGVDFVEPKILASEAIKLGLGPHQSDGWVPYHIPEQVLLSSRMHLNRDNVEALVSDLQHWLNTGELPK